MSGRISFVRFCDRVLRVRLTLGQRVVARVAFDGVEPAQLDPTERDIARTIFGDVDVIPPQARRILVLILGRGSGKTLLAAAFAIYTLVTLEITGRSLDLPTFVVIAPGKKTAIAAAVHMARELVRGAPDLERMIVAESTEGFVLRRPDGRAVQLAVFAASRGGASARGIPILGWVIDESWYLYSDDAGGFVVNDRDIVNALIPRMMKGAKGILISTPWPVETLTGSLLADNFGHPTTALACIAPTLTMRDDDPELADLIALERATDPENTARERDCDISATAGANKLIAPEAIEAAIVAEEDGPFLKPAEGGAIGWGADLAFVSDSSALCGVSRSVANRFAVISLDEMVPAKGVPLRPSDVCLAFATVMGARQAQYVFADGHYFEAFREGLEPHGITPIPAPGGASGRLDVWTRAKKLIHEGRCWLPRHTRFLNQLRSIAIKPRHGGAERDQIIIPRRKGAAHGDLAAAFALGLHAATLAQIPDDSLPWNPLINLRQPEWRGGDF